ncbi:MAG: hypothetical protein CVU29_10860 [Betaproteobacteria bacterium HGW-Betaproteobacteria-22]|nr:MAG: hypothetical protein CVU29_10860 [Betaproteobacteria bacterium HGW-Betaproteobacteria-22]
MDFISNFIVQSPFLFLTFMLMLAGVFFISSMYFLLQKAKKQDQIQNAIKQKKLAELKAHEEYKAQFRNIHHVRKKFKELKR